MGNDKYKNLLIDNEKIIPWIRFWCEENLTEEFSISRKKLNGYDRYLVKTSNEEIMIDFFNKDGGLKTIRHTVGTQREKSEKIAESIYNRVKDVLKNSPFSNGFSIKMEHGDFEVFISLVNDIDGVAQIRKENVDTEGKAKYELYRFRGAERDEVTIKYYLGTSRMQMQGKPLVLFNDMLAILCEEASDKDEVVDAHIQYCNVDLRLEDVDEELRNVLGEGLYKFLNKSLRATLSTSLILYKVEVTLPDYSAIVFPAYRALEGFLKKVFTQNYLDVDSVRDINEFFDFPTIGVPQMKEEYVDIVGEDKSDTLTDMYKFYRKNRHPIAHSSFKEEKVMIIQDRKIANEKLYEVVEKMKKWYDWHKEK